MYADLNVKWPTGINVNQAESRVREMLAFLSLLQYDVVALNITVTSPKEAKQVLATSLTEAVFARLKAAAPNIKLLKRVTLLMEDSSSSPNVGILAEPGLFDIIAVMPKTEKQLQSCATALDIDLICIDTGGRLPFPLRHKLCGAAVSRGVNFEVCYASPKSMRHLISNAVMLFRAARNRGIIISSGASAPADLRAPLDIANLVTLWGLNASSAKKSVSQWPIEAATQGILRSRSAKQAVLPVKKLKID